MLTKIRLTNFKSFKEETIIDVAANKCSMLENTNTSEGILKGLVFVGGNATGKTNVLHAIRILLDLLFTNAIIPIHDYFCIFSKGKNMKLEYEFKIENDCFVYRLEFNKDGAIDKEKLTLNGDEILNRIGLSADTLLTENKIYDATRIDRNTPFLKSIYFNTKFTNHSSMIKWFDFLSNSIYFNVHRASLFHSHALAFNTNVKVNLMEYLEENGEKKINDFFKSFKFNQEIKYKAGRKPQPDFLEAISGSKIKEIDFKRNNIDTWLPFAYESLGNQTLVRMLPSILHIVNTNGMFIVDEFSSAFHNELEELIIRFFMNNAKKSQMFFVSHSTNLLKNTLLRPDQIYAVDFDDEKGSRIKKFSSEHPRESQNIEKMYLSGVFNGLPNYGVANENKD
ncbi:MAG: ATP-binding protein [Clostridiales bacterium]|jgi:AAA15 family ATPase/GTPase|nr:ATP-binding protein [Clostridiales bacterium]